MPVYRFKCKKCEEEFTALTAMGRENEIKCKKCGSSNIEKLLPRFFIGKTAEGKITGGACSTCSASSCTSCGGS
ncbi:zinc ribbon domain-containing protein [Candidatus Aerophobetes bacterium]|nr:zinc ribbon domain-containing protein [Candidatus Aerophobetes bacterium]